jgi:WD40 repeat protein/biotin carboxyl carrier protein
MFARLTGLTGLALALTILVGCSDTPRSSQGDENGGNAGSVAVVEIGPYLYGEGPQSAGHRQKVQGLEFDPVVVADCRFAVPQDRKQEVPSQRDGVLLFIGTEIEPGEEVPEDRLIKATVAVYEKTDDKEVIVTKEKKFRQLREGDKVKAGQLMAVLDHRVAFAEVNAKRSQVEAAALDKKTSERIRDEAYQTYLTTKRLIDKVGGSSANEELRRAQMTHERYVYEVRSKSEAILKAEAETKQAEIVLELHQIRSTIGGEIRTVYKSAGESVKASEAVFLLHNCDRLQVEGLMDSSNLMRLRNRNFKIVVEPTLSESPDKNFDARHRQEVTSVAVGKGPDFLIASGSDDGTVRIWHRKEQGERRVLQHPAPVRAVACTPQDAEANLVLSGANDGKGRLWDLDQAGAARELQGQHRGAMTCVAFSPGGQWCLTGGDDRDIMLWDVSTGVLKYRFPAGHRGAVTSAGRDNTLRLWTLGQEGARLERTIDRRSGDVANLGVSPDGKQALFEQGKRLSLLDISHPDCPTDAVLQTSSGGANFTTFALFSPDARLILTAGASNGRLQLWRPPTATTHGYEVRQLAKDRSAATCAAFAPDSSFIVTGTRDHHVHVWQVPPKDDIEREFVAASARIDTVMEGGGRQVRVRAELDNPYGKLLMPGNTATLTLYPK